MRYCILGKELSAKAIATSLTLDGVGEELSCLFIRSGKNIVEEDH